MEKSQKDNNAKKVIKSMFDTVMQVHVNPSWQLHQPKSKW